jgi:deoxyribodipyrimidine photolyase-related protein
MKSAAAKTIWLLEDQLSISLVPPGREALLIESNFAFRMLKYHRKRLTFLISSMRHFRDELIAAGRTVHYYPLQARGYRDSISALRHFIKTTGQRQLRVVQPSEYHTKTWIESLGEKLNLQIDFEPNELFLTDRIEFADWARSVRSPLMETFYRRMRVKHRVLMTGGKPAGGTWNFDKQNRKSPPGELLIPAVPNYPPDSITHEVMDEINGRFSDHPGSTDGFNYPVTRVDARHALQDFLDHRLSGFGDYEDAMLTGQPVLYHSRLSSVLNNGLLEPLECIRAAEACFKKGTAPLNAVEGFIRQILGWREYMYGIYWTFMPEYRNRNARGDSLPLPGFFWSADTEMNCLHRTIGSVVEHAYSHHIQRLMVICNFATLVGFSPQAVNDWFLELYVDSHDWVVTPNVIGMGLNADGGTCATKPYVSSGAYINRMSDYCKSCKYNVTHRVGPDACPYNYLYWTFLETNRKTLERNPRIGMVLKNLDRFDPAELKLMRQQRQALLTTLSIKGVAY